MMKYFQNTQNLGYMTNLKIKEKLKDLENEIPWEISVKPVKELTPLKINFIFIV